jgi:hypothetical protein
MTSFEESAILCNFLPLLREHVPSAAEEIESDIISLAHSEGMQASFLGLIVKSNNREHFLLGANFDENFFYDQIQMFMTYILSRNWMMQTWRRHQQLHTHCKFWFKHVTILNILSMEICLTSLPILGYKWTMRMVNVTMMMSIHMIQMIQMVFLESFCSSNYLVRSVI